MCKVDFIPFHDNEGKLVFVAQYPECPNAIVGQDAVWSLDAKTTIPTVRCSKTGMYCCSSHRGSLYDCYKTIPCPMEAKNEIR